MVQEIKIKCDIQDCDNPVFDDSDHRLKGLRVIFETEQQEGRSTHPYFYKVDIDICSQCISKMLESKKYITAKGAMGYNKYFIQ